MKGKGGCRESKEERQTNGDKYRDKGTDTKRPRVFETGRVSRLGETEEVEGAE